MARDKLKRAKALKSVLWAQCGDPAEAPKLVLLRPSAALLNAVKLAVFRRVSTSELTASLIPPTTGRAESSPGRNCPRWPSPHQHSDPTRRCEDPDKLPRDIIQEIARQPSWPGTRVRWEGKTRDWPSTAWRGLARRRGVWFGDGPSFPVVVSLHESETKRNNWALRKRKVPVESYGLRFISFPIPDRGIPVSTPAALALLNSLTSLLEHGKSIAIHCRQSVGRSGLVASGLLLIAGVAADDAIARVSEARGVTTPETPAQPEWTG